MLLVVIVYDLSTVVALLSDGVIGDRRTAGLNPGRARAVRKHMCIEMPVAWGAMCHKVVFLFAH